MGPLVHDANIGDREMRMKGFTIERPHSVEYSFENLGMMLRSHCWPEERNNG